MTYEAELHEAEQEHFLFEHFLGEHEQSHEHEVAHEAELNEAEVHELASRFLELETEAELDRFLPFLLPVAKLAISGLGKLAAKGVGKLAARTAGKLVKGVARRGLSQLRRPGRRPFRARPAAACNCPQQETEHFLGNVLGGLFGGGGELELESHEAQFEAAKQFVRFGNAALCRSLSASRRLPPAAAARAGIVSAARSHAPGLLRRVRRCSACGSTIPSGVPRAGMRRPGPARPAAGRPAAVGRAPAPAPVRADSNGVSATQGRWVRRGTGVVLTRC